MKIFITLSEQEKEKARQNVLAKIRTIMEYARRKRRELAKGSNEGKGNIIVVK